MKEENRLYPRFNYSSPARCAYMDTFPETFPVIVVDISPEGIGFVSDKKLEVGTEMYFLMDLDGGESVKFITKVRWSNKLPNIDRFMIGVKIHETNRKDLQKFIRFYCATLIPGDHRKKKVLVIESDKNTVKLLCDEIGRNGYEIVCSYDGEDGFSKYMEENPDLVILNFTLPKLNGHEVCRKIRRLQNDRQTTIFMVINKKKEVSKIVEDDIGIQKYFLKPLNAGRIMEEVNRFMALSRK